MKFGWKKITEVKKEELDGLKLDWLMSSISISLDEIRLNGLDIKEEIDNKISE